MGAALVGPNCCICSACLWMLSWWRVAVCWFWMEFAMLSSQSTASASTVAQANSEPSLTPLILFAASPGTITGVITFLGAHTAELPITALVLPSAVMVTWFVALFFALLHRQTRRWWIHSC